MTTRFLLDAHTVYTIKTNDVRPVEDHIPPTRSPDGTLGVDVHTTEDILSDDQELWFYRPQLRFVLGVPRYFHVDDAVYSLLKVKRKSAYK